MKSNGRPQGYILADHGPINDEDGKLMNSTGGYKGTSSLITVLLMSMRLLS